MESEKSTLFDASSLIELLKHGNGATGAAFGQYTLDLAFYEAGNSFWSDSAAQQVMSREDASAAVDYLESLREEMVVCSLSDLGATAVFETAWDEGVTYYDGAYITAAQAMSATLVTEDTGMADHTPESVSVTTVEELLEGG